MQALSMITASKKEIAMGTYGVGTEIHAVDTELRSSVRPSIFAISPHSKMRAMSLSEANGTPKIVFDFRVAPRVQRGFTEAVKGIAVSRYKKQQN